MNASTNELRHLADDVAAMRRELTALGDRVTALERAGAAHVGESVATAAAKAPLSAREISDELVAIISAALAAYLGVKPHIRQIRILGGASWAQQGRVSVQASHRFAIQRD
ncbi:MAG TPA: hypothetical protein PKC18_12790 [Lacipirellulaceae bacterium]|nr:hypothetical protein [Lacipirellulaceae bacterium]HMP05847.1 hypothetical protein [Lacipirellulaceae bacterium]